MFFWTPYGFVRLTFFFIAGILLGIYQPRWLNPSHGLTLLAGIVLLILWINWRQFKVSVIGPLVLIALVLAGYLNTLIHTQSLDSRHFMHAESIDMYTAVVTSYPEEKAKSWKTTANIRQIHYGNEWHEATGKVLLYFSKEEFNKPFQYGDVLLVYGAPALLQPPANPGEFDYRRFLSFRNIYHQHFIRQQQVIHYAYDPPYSLFELAYASRAWAEGVLKKNIQGQREVAVASALILGIRDGLDQEIVQAYSASGAMHVLAVSGLHVGIVYFFISFFFKPFERRHHARVAIALMSIALLWFYAFLTGLSPSVMRAVTMFTILGLARAFSRSSNIYNTLAATAFVLLLFDPFMIMSVGFQLSFLAVLGIVYLQPRLYQLWIPRSMIMDKVWQITCVSFAAQAATFSLGLLYYHQFPVYFLVSNLFVIPGALLSLCIGLFLLAVGGLPKVANIAGNIFEDLLFLLNDLVYRVEALPFSLISDIRISTLQSWLLISMIISAVLLLEYRRFAFVVSLALSGLLFGGLQWHHEYTVGGKAKFTVYYVRGESAMEWMVNGKAYLMATHMLINDPERIRFHIRPNRLMHNIRSVEVNPADFVLEYPGFRMYAWGSWRIGQLTGSLESLPVDMPLDYLVISHNAMKKLETKLLSKVGHIIIDSSNSYFNASRMIEEADRVGLKVHSVLHHGAFVLYL